MKPPTMTTRRWMIVVAVVAILSAVLIQTEQAWKRRARYASALSAFRKSETHHREGRIRLPDWVEKSRRLMEAELQLHRSQKGRVAAIKAHLARASSMIDEEINRPEVVLHDDLFHRQPEIWEARESLLEDEARLDSLIKAR